MITPRRSAERGHADHGWLDAYHTFSFADYHDPAHMGFSLLRVINQDKVAPGAGFPTHPHRNMEIVTYVYNGALAHKDSMGNGSTMRAGEVQLMSAGKGVTHSEFNASESDPLELLQMWVHPTANGTAPRYEQRDFGTAERQGRWTLAVAPANDDEGNAGGALTIGTDARMWLGLFDAGESDTLELGEGRAAWLHVARGAVEMNGLRLAAGDGAAIRDEREVRVVGASDAGETADVLLWDLPA